MICGQESMCDDVFPSAVDPDRGGQEEPGSSAGPHRQAAGQSEEL